MNQRHPETYKNLIRSITPMTNGSAGDRLDRIENALERLIGGLENTKTNIDRLNVGLEETRALANSNSRTIQAILEQQATDRLRHQERMDRLEATVTRLDETIVRLTRIEEAQNRMLANIDEDRPTILRKLTSIENKVDRILEEGQQ